MRKLIYTIATAIIFSLAFTSCEDKNGNRNGYENGNGNGNAQEFTIMASNVQGSGVDRIVTVEASVFHWDGVREGAFTVGKAPFQNRGFNITLSTDIPSLFLMPIYDTFGDEGNVIVSDGSANITGLGEGLYALDSNGNEIGLLGYFAETNTAFYIATWIYVDRDVTVRGRDGWENFDLNLKRGWNAIFVREGESEDDDSWSTTITTQRPSNVTFVWEFWSWDDWSSEFSTTTRTERRSGNSIFTRR